RAFKLLYENPRSRLIGHDDLLASMDAHNVEKSICLSFQWEDPEDCYRENEYILKSAADSGGRIVPFGMISENEKDPKARAGELAHAGFEGVGEIAFYEDGLNGNKDNYLTSLFEGCMENNLIVMLHVNEPVGKKYPGKTSTDFEFLTGLISGFPDLKLICAHWGGGLFAYELIKGISDVCTNVYYDCAASPYVYDRRIYETAISAIGSDRIIFGSDYPLISPDRYYRELTGIPVELRNKILYDNAKKLLGRE
ncbi:MAG TPA: amidohydrolase family protein, partial [Spirochaetota bacterium]|nr:amidohydrolase family protein [Spirochaetota bacterium]